jgi:predicted transcriptional regulator
MYKLGAVNDPETPPAPVDEAGRAKFRERLGSALTDAGMPRMPSRVFAALFSADTGRMTAAELTDTLQVSPAAISGAVRYLTQLGMASREREPGSRRDHYVVRDDVWQRMMAQRDRLMGTLLASVREGITLIGTGSPAGRRAADTLEFLEFLEAELPRVVNRWFEQRG